MTRFKLWSTKNLSHSFFEYFKHLKLVSHLHGSCRQYVDANITEQVKDIKYVFDLRDPGQFFSEARSMKRHVIFHSGPTNSGKTYHAIQSFLNANTAIYCGPLRMLAGEIFRKSNSQKVLCDLITGEERLWAVSEEEPSNHSACTVELCSTNQQYDVAVIDEIQMLRDYDRGWAWTRALLGVPAKEIHVCGEESALKVIKSLLEKTDDTFEVKKYERLTPLKLLNRSIDLHDLRRGDCVIAFSQKNIYNLRLMIERVTNKKCGVIYGNLPSNVRFEQARKFNDGDCDILVASDAIGMGLNLNIERIVFSATKKFNGYEFTDLTPSHMKQIAGRAGRFKSKFQVGYITALEQSLMTDMKYLMEEPTQMIKKAGVLPSFAQLELLSVALPGKSLLSLLDIFELLIQLDRNYFMCDVERMKIVAQELGDIPLTLHESYLFSIAPMNIMKSSFVSSCMKQFAWSVSFDSVVTEKKVRQIIRWPPRSQPKTLKQLQHLEYLHETFDLYRWLSYRFPEIFIDAVKVIRLQEKLEKTISQAVDANLKNYHEHESNVKRFIANRKRKKL